MEICFTVRGNPVTKKNSQSIIQVKRRDGSTRPVPLPSSQYRQYAEDFAWQVPSSAKLAVASPVNLQCLYYMATRRRCDLVNLLEATQDILTDVGVLSDDNRDIVASTDGSRVYYDSNDPRVEICITDLPDYEQWTASAPKKPRKRKGIFAK